MNNFRLVIAVAIAAVCIGLTVRLFNRRKRWSNWTIVAVACLPIFYVLTFGPACWITAAPRVSGAPDSPRLWMRLYFPIGAVIHRTQSQDSKFVRRWITCGARRGGRVIVPVDASGTNWYGFTAE